MSPGSGTWLTRHAGRSSAAICFVAALPVWSPSNVSTTEEGAQADFCSAWLRRAPQIALPPPENTPNSPLPKTQSRRPNSDSISNVFNKSHTKKIRNPDVVVLA